MLIQYTCAVVLCGEILKGFMVNRFSIYLYTELGQIGYFELKRYSNN